MHCGRIANAEAPIGLIDSGLGGVSVLHEIRKRLPLERLIYSADRAFCPYGSLDDSRIRQRVAVLAERLVADGVKMIVLACNTATIAAIAELRARHSIPFVGMEPAVKPAARLSQSKVVGVLATGPALAGAKFQQLVKAHADGVHLLTQACPGLVEQVESLCLNGERTDQLLRQYIGPLLENRADVLVLGCTHYPLLREAIARVAGPGVQIVDSGEAVARRVHSVLDAGRALYSGHGSAPIQWHCSRDPVRLARDAQALLDAQAVG